MMFDFIRIMSVLFVIGTFGFPILAQAQASNSVEAAQIISIKNSSFHLELDRLKQIVEADDIKDRQVIIVSIAGPYRTGKSFLLSIFLKYLYAEVWFIQLKLHIVFGINSFQSFFFYEYGEFNTVECRTRRYAGPHVNQ